MHARSVDETRAVNACGRDGLQSKARDATRAADHMVQAFGIGAAVADHQLPFAAACVGISRGDEFVGNDVAATASEFSEFSVAPHLNWR
jgi:hypothetical protein